jgi:hypothetical protein
MDAKTYELCCDFSNWINIAISALENIKMNFIRSLLVVANIVILVQTQQIVDLHPSIIQLIAKNCPS